MQDRLPARTPKTAKPQRFGTLFWLRRGGDVLLVRRPASGLLGGMRALPTGAWRDAAAGLEDAPATADWRLLDANVRHVFTHFALDVALAAARIESDCNEHAAGEWWPLGRIDDAGLPTVFLKAARVFIREGP